MGSVVSRRHRSELRFPAGLVSTTGHGCRISGRIGILLQIGPFLSGVARYLRESGTFSGVDGLRFTELRSGLIFQREAIL